MFDKACLEEWLKMKQECPTCRAAVSRAYPLAVNKVICDVIRDLDGPLLRARAAAEAAVFYAALAAADAKAAHAALVAGIALEDFVGDAAARDTPLLRACRLMRGDNVLVWVDVVQKLVEMGADVHAHNAAGKSTLLAVVEAMHFTAFTKLPPLLFNKGAHDPLALVRLAAINFCNFLDTDIDGVDAAWAPLAANGCMDSLASPARVVLVDNLLKKGFDRCADALLGKVRYTVSSPLSAALARDAAIGGCARVLERFKPYARFWGQVPEESLHLGSAGPMGQAPLHIACMLGRGAAALVLVRITSLATLGIFDGFAQTPSMYARRWADARGMAAVLAALKARLDPPPPPPPPAAAAAP